MKTFLCKIGNEFLKSSPATDINFSLKLLITQQRCFVNYRSPTCMQIHCFFHMNQSGEHDKLFLKTDNLKPFSGHKYKATVHVDTCLAQL